MDDGGGRKNGKFQVVRGALYGRPRSFNRQRAAMGFTTAEFRLDKEMADAFTAMEAEDGTVPSRGVQEIRQHMQYPWRVLARRFREARQAGVQQRQLYEVVHVLNSYIASLYAEKGKRRA